MKTLFHDGTKNPIQPIKICSIFVKNKIKIAKLFHILLFKTITIIGNKVPLCF